MLSKRMLTRKELPHHQMLPTLIIFIEWDSKDEYKTKMFLFQKERYLLLEQRENFLLPLVVGGLMTIML